MVYESDGGDVIFLAEGKESWDPWQGQIAIEVIGQTGVLVKSWILHDCRSISHHHQAEHEVL